MTLKTLREKCLEYTQRAETLKEGLAGKGGKKKGAAAGGGGGKDDDDDDDDDEEEPEPLTEEQLQKAEQEMEEELSKLVGMESVKQNMRKLCKQLSLDIRRRQEGRDVLDSIRHMMFTGNPGVGKTTVSRLVAKLYYQLGVSSKDTVVEVQKGDLVAGYVNQTAMKTAKKIREARGGILFVDEAYQLTQACCCCGARAGCCCGARAGCCCGARAGCCCGARVTRGVCPRRRFSAASPISPARRLTR